MTVAMEAVRLAILTISDGVAGGTREDAGGALIERWAAAHGYVQAARLTLPDDTSAITAALLELADSGRVDVVLTTGGTGLTARDVTPEATLAVLEREAPGIAERLRAVGAAATPHAALSRGVAGTRGATLIINLPGGEGGVRDGLRTLEDFLVHAVQLVRGVRTDRHEPTHG